METRNRGRRRKPVRWLAGLLGSLAPGAGHLYLGYVAQGLLLLAAAVADGAAIVYYANAGGGRYLLWIVYLGLLLPALYGYSVYDVLQLADSVERTGVRRGRLLRVRQACALVVTGALILLLLHPPAWFASLLREAGDYAPAALLAFLAAWLLRLAAGGRWPLGRVSGALVLAASAVAIALDQAVGDGSGATYLAYWLDWWPIIFVLLGLEALALRWRRPVRYRLDGLALFAAVVASAAAVGVAHYADLPARWLDQFASDPREIATYTGDAGFAHTLDPIRLSMSEVRELRIDNPNGAVTIRAAESADAELRIETVVWVDLPDEDDARAIAEASTVQVGGEGEMLTIQGQGELYGPESAWRPRINLTITLPAEYSYAADEAPELPIEGSGEERGDASTSDEAVAEAPPSLTILVRGISGNVDARGIAATEGLRVESAYGEIEVERLLGPLSIDVRSGGIIAADIDGRAELKASNGHIAASRVRGEAHVSTINGDLELTDISGLINAATKHGAIQIDEAADAVSADTLNGIIEVRSSRIGGDWQLDSAIGDITVELPEEGDYRVSGAVTFGEIHSQLPLVVEGSSVSGSAGRGRYLVSLQGNSSIYLRPYR